MLSRITPPELKSIPCILVASGAQRETEQEYYRTVVGIQSEFLYAENMEEGFSLSKNHCFRLLKTVVL